MSDETNKRAPVCECGRACTRGRYGYFQATCGAPECVPPEPATKKFTVFAGTKRNRNGLGTTSVKALDKDFERGQS